MPSPAITEPPRYLEIGSTRIRRFTRGAFRTRRFAYRAGEHVAFIGPTQDGKTTLAFQLLETTAKPTLPATVLVMKPRDPVPAAWTRHLGYVETPTWPPRPRRPWESRPGGYTLWPKHSFNVEEDNAHLSREFERAIRDSYAKGNCILFADEVYGILAELDGLEDDLIAMWSRGGGMGTGLWASTQRPAGSAGHGVPGFMYSNSQHLFLGRDPDARSRQRYGEIGGTDPKLLAAATLALRKYEFIYVNKGDAQGGPYLAVIEAS